MYQLLSAILGTLTLKNIKHLGKIMYSVLTGHSGISIILIFNKIQKHSNSFCLFILNLNLHPSNMTTLDAQNSLSFKVQCC